VVPQSVHMKATRPGPPANGAISATLDIGCPHRLQAFCATTVIVLELVRQTLVNGQVRLRFNLGVALAHRTHRRAAAM